MGTQPHSSFGRSDSALSYSEGFSMTHDSGDAETQTPRHRTRDQEAQVDIHYPSTAGEPRPLTNHTHFQLTPTWQLLPA